MIHQINIMVHVTAGTIALLVGILILATRKGTMFHKHWGKVFIYLLFIVNTSAFLGWIFFRSNPFLLMLTLLAGYNTFSGYRNIKIKHARGTWADQGAAMLALSTGAIYLFYLMNSDAHWSAAVIYPTVGSLAFVTIYDILRNAVIYPRAKHWWLYEHIYKIISSFGAILSAFTGTVLPQYKPFSQAGPGIVCWLMILIFIFAEARKRSAQVLKEESVANLQ